MKRSMLCATLVGALVVGAADFAHAKKPVQTDVQKALQEIYSDAQTQILGSRDMKVAASTARRLI